MLCHRGSVAEKEKAATAVPLDVIKGNPGSSRDYVYVIDNQSVEGVNLDQRRGEVKKSCNFQLCRRLETGCDAELRRDAENTAV
jgi:hypothetical protein